MKDMFFKLILFYGFGPILALVLMIFQIADDNKVHDWVLVFSILFFNACISSAVGISIGLMIGYPFPTMRAKDWPGRMLGIVISAIFLYSFYLWIVFFGRTEDYYILWSVFTVGIGIIALAFLTFITGYLEKHPQQSTGDANAVKEPHVFLWFFIAFLFWVAIYFVDIILRQAM